jgi:hypothetical protein
MSSVRTTTLSLVALLASAGTLFAQEAVVSDTLLYPDVTAFRGNWATIGGSVSVNAQTGLTMSNCLAIRNFGPTASVQPEQNWTLNCAVAQTSFSRGQWFGLFTNDMCHGYIGRWDSSVAGDFGGQGTFSLYKYDSTTPLPNWSTGLGNALATGGGNQLVAGSKPASFQLASEWNAVTQQKQITLIEQNAAGQKKTIQAKVSDSNAENYTRVVFSGNTSGIFSKLSLTSDGQPASGGNPVNPQLQTFNIKTYGAIGDGVTDDTAAINRAIAAAQEVGGNVYIPAATHAYIYSSCISMNGISVYGDGDQSLLQAADPRNSAFIISGDKASLSSIKITSPLSSTIGRQTTPQTGAVMINKASNFVVQDVDVDTTASVGIISLGGYGTASSPSVISHCNIANTLADGIHMTDKSCYLNVQNNTVTNSGDDMFAVVSYTRDGGLCHDIEIQNNSGNGQSANGRGISVVGGSSVTILNNNIQRSRGAGVYLQSELIRNPDGSLLYKTFGDDSITVQGNVLNDLASTVYHGGINMGGRAADTTDVGQTETQDQLITNVTVTGNTITDAHHSGVSLQSYFNGIHLEGNTIDTTAEQGIEVFGGSNLYVGDETGNTLKNIGNYGVYTGVNSYMTTFTSGTILFENNVFGDTNVLGTYAIPVISIGTKTIDGKVAANAFNPSGKYLISTPYVRYGVE